MFRSTCWSEVMKVVECVPKDMLIQVIRLLSMFHKTRWFEDLGLSSNVEHDAVHMHVSVLRGVILLSQ